MDRTAGAWGSGQPHYGGIIERVIGTMMEAVHELPGVTFCGPRQRGSYDSDATAALTVRELERLLALAVATYHGQLHGGLGCTPAGRWAEGVAATGIPATVTSEAAFLVDFLPVSRRTLTRTGFVIGHVHYCDALKPWIACRGRLGRFVIRRDPRDISRIWVLDPDGGTYLQVPYRTLSHPPISAWEQRAAVANAARARGQRLGPAPGDDRRADPPGPRTAYPAGNSVSRIARLLGVSRSTTYKYLPELADGHHPAAGQIPPPRSELPAGD